MRLVTGRRIVSAPKAVFALVFFGSAIACDGSSHGLPTPMAQDDAGLARSWMTCPDPIEIVLDARLGRAPHVLELTQKAAAAWQTPGVARLRVRSGATSGVNEDGVNVLTFAPPFWLCPKETGVAGSFCISAGGLGVTRLVSRPRKEGAEILEADVLFKRSLLSEHALLYSTLLHEFGHVLGLDHAGAERPASTTVMMAIPPPDAIAPGSADLDALRAAYKGRCR